MPAEILGRDAELRVIDGFLHAISLEPGALVLTGAAGAGKTTLLRAAVTRAAERGVLVLAAMPSASELRLAFAGLADLLEPWLDQVLAELPPPQRRALRVALLLEDVASRPAEPAVIAAALRGALAVLARSAPVLVVIDDVQWLDLPTAAAVGLACRRISGEPVGLLCAQRVTGPDEHLPLELGESALVTEVLSVGGLSIGALHHLLRLRLGTSFSRPALRRIEAESAGNPFIALEIGRALARRGVTPVGTSAWPVPDTLSGLVAERLGELPPATLDALRVVAIMPDAPVSRYIAAGVDAADLDAAVRGGVLAADGGRLRFSHPLLASAIAGSILPGRKRELHAIAAGSAQLPEERARHRALAAAGPAAATAAELTDAARTAASRGAAGTAAELFELAASLTPEDRRGDAHRRLLDAARQLSLAGESRGAIALLEQLITDMPAGSARAEALGQLAWNFEDDFEMSTALLDQALAEAGDSLLLRADIHLSRSDIWAIRGDLPGARVQAHLALADAEQSTADRALLASCLAQAFLFDWYCDAQQDERMLDRALELERAVGSLQLRTPPSQVAGIYHMRAGRLDQAEEVLQRALSRAEADGAEYWRADVLLRLSQVVAKKGESRRAAELAAAGLEIAEQLDLKQLISALLYGYGYAMLQLGRVDEVRECARRGLELSAAAGDRAYLYGHEALLGSLELATGEFAPAASRLMSLLDRMRSVGPARRYAVQEAVEALVAAGDLDQARGLMAELADSGPLNPAADAVTARCDGVLAAASGDLDRAESRLRDAVMLHDQTDPQPLDRGRTLLVLGGVQRRLKRRRAAGETLQAAIAAFDGIGAVLWATRGRAELARVTPGRAPGAGELTATELTVARLAASGLTNRAAAAELFLTERAVESTLTKVYAKLGVASRTQLAARLRDNS